MSGFLNLFGNQPRPGERRFTRDEMAQIVDWLAANALGESAAGTDERTLTAQEAPHRLIARITGQQTPGLSLYSWELAVAGAVTEAVPFHRDRAGFRGDFAYLPAREISGNVRVPLDGTAIVELLPSAGGQYYSFFWPEGAVPALIVGGGSLSLTGATGGTFTLTATAGGTTRTTAALAYNATAAQVQAALLALSNVTGPVTVTGPAGGPWVITFDPAAGAVSLTVDGAALTGTSPTADLTTTPYGWVEAQTNEGGAFAALASSGAAMILTGAATGGTFTVSVTAGGSTQTTAAIAYNATAAVVQAAVAALSNVGSLNVTVTGSAAAGYVLTFAAALGPVTVTFSGGSLTGGTGTAGAFAATGGRSGTSTVNPAYGAGFLEGGSAVWLERGYGACPDIVTIVTTHGDGVSVHPVHSLELVSAVGGTWTVSIAAADGTVGETAPLRYDAAAADVQAALRALAGWGATTVTGSGTHATPFVVTLADTVADVPALVGDPFSLVGVQEWFVAAGGGGIDVVDGSGTYGPYGCTTLEVGDGLVKLRTPAGGTVQIPDARADSGGIVNNTLQVFGGNKSFQDAVLIGPTDLVTPGGSDVAAVDPPFAGSPGTLIVGGLNSGTPGASIPGLLTVTDDYSHSVGASIQVRVSNDATTGPSGTIFFAGTTGLGSGTGVTLLASAPADADSPAAGVSFGVMVTSSNGFCCQHSTSSIGSIDYVPVMADSLAPGWTGRCCVDPTTMRLVLANGVGTPYIDGADVFDLYTVGGLNVVPAVPRSLVTPNLTGDVCNGTALQNLVALLVALGFLIDGTIATAGYSGVLTLVTSVMLNAPLILDADGDGMPFLSGTTAIVTIQDGVIGSVTTGTF